MLVIGIICDWHCYCYRYRYNRVLYTWVYLGVIFIMNCRSTALEQETLFSKKSENWPTILLHLSDVHIPYSIMLTSNVTLSSSSNTTSVRFIQNYSCTNTFTSYFFLLCSPHSANICWLSEWVILIRSKESLFIFVLIYFSYCFTVWYQHTELLWSYDRNT